MGIVFTLTIQSWALFAILVDRSLPPHWALCRVIDPGSGKGAAKDWDSCREEHQGNGKKATSLRVPRVLEMFPVYPK